MTIPTDQHLDLSVDEGVPFTFDIDAGEDPTGWTAHLQVRDRPKGLVFADLTVSHGIALDSADQQLTVTFSPAQIAMFALRSVYDLVVTPHLGTPVRLALGYITVSPAVTR